MTASMEDDDFARKVFCVLGVPIDEISMAGLVGRIHQAASARQPLFISTPNLNYLMLSQRDPAFRRSLLESDICPADGVGVLLICRLLGIPITSRVAGSDLPAALQTIQTSAGSGPSHCAHGWGPGSANGPAEAINAGDTDRLLCVAAIDPGVMTAEKMGDPSAPGADQRQQSGFPAGGAGGAEGAGVAYGATGRSLPCPSSVTSAPR